MRLEDRIRDKMINFDSLNPFFRKQIDPLAAEGKDTGFFGTKRLWDRYAVPVLSNLYERSAESNGGKVYNNIELSDIFESAPSSGGEVPQPDGFPEFGEYYKTDGLPVKEFQKSKKVRPKNIGAFSSFKNLSPTTKRNLKRIAIYGSISVGIASLITGIALMVRANRKKKKEENEKKASILPDSWVGALARRVVPELSIADSMFTAETPSDYKDVNESLRQLAQRRSLEDVPKLNGRYIWPSDVSVAFSKPVFRPGDDVNIQKVNGSLYGRGTDASILHLLNDRAKPSAKDSRITKWKDFASKNDPRTAAVSSLAAGFLPSSWKFKGGDENMINIGNLADKIPFVLGQTALDRNMTDEEIDKWISAGRDSAVMDSLSDQINKYPAIRNALSAFVNGGFGRTGDAEKFGIKNPMWDYKANALTPYGSNTLHNAAYDLWKIVWTGNEERLPKRHYNELLRLADGVFPKVLKQNTALGNQMLIHQNGGILPTIDRIIDKLNPYLEKNKDVVWQLRSSIGSDVIDGTMNEMRSLASEKAK